MLGYRLFWGWLLRDRDGCDPADSVRGSSGMPGRLAVAQSRAFGDLNQLREPRRYQRQSSVVQQAAAFWPIADVRSEFCKSAKPIKPDVGRWPASSITTDLRHSFASDRTLSPVLKGLGR